MRNEDLVFETNQRFYQAINDQDLVFMKMVWCDDDSSLCIHPGWRVIHGYESIVQSWQDIFSSPDPMEIRLTNVDVVASADLAWVTCEETIFSITIDGVKSSKAYATNIFKLVNGRWKIALHHASSLPDLSTEEEFLPG